MKKSIISLLCVVSFLIYSYKSSFAFDESFSYDHSYNYVGDVLSNLNLLSPSLQEKEYWTRRDFFKVIYLIYRGRREYHFQSGEELSRFHKYLIFSDVQVESEDDYLSASLFLDSVLIGDIVDGMRYARFDDSITAKEAFCITSRIFTKESYFEAEHNFYEYEDSYEYYFDYLEFKGIINNDSDLLGLKFNYDEADRYLNNKEIISLIYTVLYTPYIYCGYEPILSVRYIDQLYPFVPESENEKHIEL